MKRIIGATCCSGIGAPEVAAPWVCWRWCAEIEKFPAAVLAARHPASQNLGDITAEDFLDRAKSMGPIDLLVAGTPRQAFSRAGLRKSLADARGNLTLRFIEIVHDIKPAFVVWENVPGVLSTSDNALGCFLGGLVGADSAIEPAGGRWLGAGVADGPLGAAAWRVLDAQYYGLAQRRRRLFVVFRTGKARRHPAEILFEWESMRRDFAPSRETGEGIAGTFTSNAGGGGCLGGFEYSGGLVDCQPEDLAGTISARTKGGGGLGTDFELAGGLQVCRTLNAEGGGGRMDATTETYVVDVSLEVAHTLRGAGFDASEDGSGRGTPIVPVEPFTLAERGRDGGCSLEYRSDGTTNALLTPGGGRGGLGVGAVATTSSVRRLTPRECERLQGFPDDYTAIPGYSRDRTGEFGGNNGVADGPRYKAIGNSMAVPVMRWIIGRVGEALNE